MDLTINPRFEKLLPALSSDELRCLEESLAADGCRDALIAWQGQIVDGHNRHRICTRLDIPYRVTEMDFADEDAAMDWIDKNQIARRNLTPDDFRLAVGRRYNRTKRTMPEAGAMRKASDNLSKAHTAETIARESGIDERTVRRAGKLAEAVEQVEQTEPDVAAKGRPAVIERAKEVLKPHVSNNSGDNEWYTPKPYIEAARAVMGGIDLDPASSEAANEVVRAIAIHTTETNGLEQAWEGKVWMNPPYASELVGKFIEKLAASVESGTVTEALVLVNNGTETRWFARLASVSTMICFPTGRVKFWHPRKESTPLQGQAVAYIGPNMKQFAERFKPFGIVTKVVK